MRQTIRNFSIIAHIDHGKTTLTDRLLLKTKTIDERLFRARLMDSNPIEQERGITIKMAPVRMELPLDDAMKRTFDSEMAVFNLLDTPGHVDFSYEVSRSLAAVEGALLLVDATQGVQAQTLSHYYKAHSHDLTIIPVLNKIDLSNADVDGVTLEMMELFGFQEDEFVHVSAKTGEGTDALLAAILERIPAPAETNEKPLKALVFSSHYHQHKGVVVWVRIIDGEIAKGDPVRLLVSNTQFQVDELGFLKPEILPQQTLSAGEVGYIATGLKNIGQARVGDTIAHLNTPVQSLVGYQAPQLMVFMDFYPQEGDDYTLLLEAMEKLSLHDAALQFQPTHSPALGNGLRVGFLGVLHAEIVQERLEREFDMTLLVTAPSVKYQVVLTSGEEVEVTNPAELPDPSLIERIEEPIAETTIYCPKEYVGNVMSLCEEYRGSQQNMRYIGDRVEFSYFIPLSELIVSFYDEIKSATSGFASIEYQVDHYQPVDAVKLTILVNKEPIAALSQIVVKEKAQEVGKRVVSQLKEVIPRQLFPIPLQAAVGGTVVARETVSAFRKDVTAKLYGGDRTRRKKLLEKQKKGKERRARYGKVEIPQEAFFAVLKRS